MEVAADCCNLRRGIAVLAGMVGQRATAVGYRDSCCEAGFQSKNGFKS